MVTTSGIKETSQKCFYYKLNWNSWGDHRRSCNLLFHHKIVKHFSSLCEAYSVRCQTSKMEPLAKIVNDFHLFTVFAKCYILDVCQGFEYDRTYICRIFQVLGMRNLTRPELDQWKIWKIFGQQLNILRIPSFPAASRNLSKDTHGISLIYRVLDFMKPRENCIYVDHGISGVKLLTCLSLYFSHKFCHNFKDTAHLICWFFIFVFSY